MGRHVKALDIRVVIEYGTNRDGDGTRHLVILSLPGREGTVTKEWWAPQGSLDAVQMSDLAAYVGARVCDAALTFGVQGRLPI